MAFANCAFDATDERGNLLSNVQVEVRHEASGRLAFCFSDREGAVPLGNPFEVPDGRISFFAPGGAYRIKMTGGGFMRERRFVPIGTAQETDAASLGLTGYTFMLSDETTEPPDPGQIRADDADLSAATKLYVSNELLSGTDISATLLALQPQADNTLHQVIFTDPATQATATFEIAAASAEDGYVVLDIGGFDGDSDITASTIRVNFAWAGSKGEQGYKGDKGDKGDKGWAPQLVALADSNRRVLQLAGYVGGEGTPPTDNVGEYLKPDGTYTAVIGEAMDFRGASGAGTVAAVIGGTGIVVDGTDPTEPIVSLDVADQTTAEAGTDNEKAMTALRVKQAIDALTTPFDPSELYTSNALRDLEIADLKGGRFGLSGGIADPFSDQSGVKLPVTLGNDSYTTTLLEFEGADQSTTIVDIGAASSGKVWTAAGDAKIKTNWSKFGASSVYLDGSGDRITAPAGADFNFGTADFTIDLQFRRDGGHGARRLLFGQVNSGGTTASLTVFLEVTAANLLSATLSNGSALTTVTGTTAITDSDDHHAAFVRSGTDLLLLLDGGLEDSLVLAPGYTVANGSTPFTIGRMGDIDGSYFIGWIDEFRISKGVARWTGPFTPPDEPYTTVITPGSENFVYDPANGLYRPSFNSTDERSASTGISIGGASWSYMDRSFAVDNGKVVDGFWVWSNTNFSGRLRIHQRVSAGSYTFLPGAVADFSHTGGSGAGWQFFKLATPVEMPSTGDFFCAMFSNGTHYGYGSKGARAYYQGDPSGTVTWTEEGSGVSPSIGVRYFEGTNNMTLVSVDYPSQVQPDKARLVLQIDTPLAVEPGVDFSGEVSRDGENWVEAEDLALVASIGTIKTYASGAIDLSGEPAGVDMHWRLKTLTNKDIAFTGVVENWG